MASSIETTSTTTTLKNNGNTYLSVDTNDDVTVTNDLAVSGNVGIGTASPDQKLHVAHAGRLGLRVEATTTDIAEVLLKNTTETWGIKNEGGNLVIADESTGIMATVLKDSGKVGIGTASPPQKFSVSNAGADNIVMSENSSASIQMFMQATASTGDIGTMTNHPTRILQNNTERMRIDSGGTVLMGQTTNPATATLVLKVSTGSANGVNAQITSNTGTSYPWSNYNASGTYVGGISCTSSATAFPTSSDVRLKKDIKDAPSAIEKIKAARVVSHEWKEEDTAPVEFGFVAQELIKVVPQAVIEGKDKEDGGIEIPWGVDYSKLVPLLVKTVQEQQTVIESLEARIAKLEAK